MKMHKEQIELGIINQLARLFYPKTEIELEIKCNEESKVYPKKTQKTNNEEFPLTKDMSGYAINDDWKKPAKLMQKRCCVKEKLEYNEN